MRFTKHILPLLLALAMLIAALAGCGGTSDSESETQPTTASDTEQGSESATATEPVIETETETETETRPAEPSEGLEYGISEDGNSYIVTGIGSCTDTDIVIPAEYDGKPVAGIGDKAFSGCTSLTSITIPDSVTSIGESAFYWCTNLTSITIPDSVTSIGSAALSVTPWYTAYHNDESNWTDGLLYIGSVLMYCKRYNKTGAVIIKEGTTCIASGAFEKCSGLTSITIPDSVTSIGEWAFYKCTGLTSITFAGTMEQWWTIDKGDGWATNTGSFTIHCTDGDISK